jgi:prevent-host-death family protein
MKVIPLSEVKAKLSRYARFCRDEPVVVTVKGRPSFQLVPLNEDDDLIGRLIEDYPDFRKLLERRLSERNDSVSAATRRRDARASPRTSRQAMTKPGHR